MGQWSMNDIICSDGCIEASPPRPTAAPAVQHPDP